MNMIDNSIDNYKNRTKMTSMGLNADDIVAFLNSLRAKHPDDGTTPLAVAIIGKESAFKRSDIKNVLSPKAFGLPQALPIAMLEVIANGFDEADIYDITELGTETDYADLKKLVRGKSLSKLPSDVLTKVLTAREDLNDPDIALLFVRRYLQRVIAYSSLGVRDMIHQMENRDRAASLALMYHTGPITPRSEQTSSFTQMLYNGVSISGALSNISSKEVRQGLFNFLELYDMVTLPSGLLKYSL